MSMNRQKRRSPQGKATLQLQKDINKIAQQQVSNRLDRVVDGAVTSTLAASVCVMHEAFGFGPKRIRQFIEAYNALFEKVGNDELTIDQIKERSAELGVNLKMEEKVCI